MINRSVRFDFDAVSATGERLHGRDFRAEGESTALSDEVIVGRLVRDFALQTRPEVRIFNRRVVEHPSPPSGETPIAQGGSVPDAPKRGRFVDLSHTIEDGMVTVRGFPASVVCDYLSHEDSRERYAVGTEFHIGRIDMVANTGTYVDSPFHRFADGADLRELPLTSLAELEVRVARVGARTARSVTRSTIVELLGAVPLRGRAVLVHTGWDENWGTERYFDDHPYLTADAAQYLTDQGAALVGIDSLNIDDTRDGHRPVHTRLLGAGIPIVEHLRGLEQLPIIGATFSAVPVKVRGMGTFPVRAYGRLPT